MGRAVGPTEYTEHTEIERERTFPAAAVDSLFSDRRRYSNRSDYLLLPCVQCVPWANPIELIRLSRTMQSEVTTKYGKNTKYGPYGCFVLSSSFCAASVAAGFESTVWGAPIVF